MTPYRSLLAALVAISGPTRAAAPRAVATVAAPAAHSADGSTVVSLRVVPAAAHTDVMIGLSGPVTVHDFTLASPD